MDEQMIIENGIFKGYKKKNIVQIELPEGIVAISDNAFSDFQNLYSITLPVSLTKIGNETFKNCPKLKSIDLKSVKVIGEKAFYGCTSLSEVNFGENIGYLPNAVFLNCISLANIILPKNIAYIGCECLKDCTALTDIKLIGVMEIDNNAFENCVNLCNLTLPDTLTHISPNAFSFCHKLETVTIQNRFIDIDETAFEYNVNFIIKAVQYSTAQNYAQKNGYKFLPTIVNDDYRIVTSEQLAILSKSGILLHAKKLTEGKDEILIYFDKSVKDKIINLIGGNEND